MKFVWPESIQGLGQQAGKLNLKIELFLQVLRAFGIPQRKHLYFISVSVENRIVLLQAGLEIYEILKRQAGQKKLQPFKGKEGAAKAVREKAKRE